MRVQSNKCITKIVKQAKYSFSYMYILKLSRIKNIKNGTQYKVFIDVYCMLSLYYPCLFYFHKSI